MLNPHYDDHSIKGSKAKNLERERAGKCLTEMGYSFSTAESHSGSPGLKRVLRAQRTEVMRMAAA